MSRLREYVSNTSWLALERLFRMAVGLVGWLYVARYLGPEDFGLLNYALSFVGLFATVAALGVDQLLLRELVRQPSSQAVFLGTAAG
ncbi:MAG: oligosaccharide flippase family protein, partial [Burkholderiaceae bacterium]